MNLTQDQWVEKKEADNNAFILDVRTPAEFSEGYILGAENIDIFLGQGFVDKISQLPKGNTYFVYCRSGNRSGQACVLMSQMGFTAYNLMGGVMQWQGPLER
ncbi:MAG: rhodanese-like domain-containing protein [Flavobacteriaceae bacterium]|nr:rhodanese-like domain-containing protein [Flavobacteriaceae bacterium]